MSPDESPLEAVWSMLVKHASRYEAEEMRAIDRVMRASDSLLARKPAVYLMQEEALYKTLCQVWRQPARRPGLRIIAMVSIGALRLAIQEYGEQRDTRSIVSLLEESFENLRSVV